MLIRLVNMPEVSGVGRVGDVRGKSSSERIVNLNLDVVNRRLWILVEFFINADGIREFDWRQRAYMWNNGLTEKGDIAFVSLEELAVVSQGSSIRKGFYLLLVADHHSQMISSRHLLEAR